jgi:hypothetical protein
MRLTVTCCAALIAAAATLGAAETGTKFGKGVDLTQATAIADLAAKPDQFYGKTVRVDGTVTAVCENMGCWMQLEDPASKKSVRIKVDDGVIVFPLTAKGKKASAQGVIEKVDAAAEAAHHAEMAAKETKEAKTPADAKAKADAHASHAEKPVSYQLKATGAVVY